MPASSPRDTATSGSPRRSAAAVRRREREREILQATRQLFDERGIREAQIEDIARAVGINRAIVYRHFTGKEELFSLTLVGYLEELQAELERVSEGVDSPETRLRAIVTEFVRYGVDHPSFVDIAQTLMRRTGEELLLELSEGAVFRLGRAIASCLRVVTEAVEAGNASGEFNVAEPAVLANMLYAYGLGALQLARIGILVSEAAPGVPTIDPISTERVRDDLIASALAMARSAAPSGPAGV